MSELEYKLKEEFKDKEYAHAYVNEFLNASIATQIKVLREQRGWTQKHLASLTGMKQSRISLLENVNYTRWSISTLKTLAEAFDVTLKVSFEGFSTRITDIENFNRKSLERLSRMEDLSSITNKQAKLHRNLASASELSFTFDKLSNASLDNMPSNLFTLPASSVYQLKEAA